MSQVPSNLVPLRLSQMPPAVSLTGAELLWISQNGVSKSTTITEAVAAGAIGALTAAFLTLGTAANLPNERIFTPGTGLSAVDGGAGNPYTLRLADTAVAPATYGDSSHVGAFTVDQQGRLTFASSVLITPAAIGAVQSVTGTVNQITVTGTTNPVLSIPATFIAPGSIAATTTVTGTNIIPSGSGVPANGMYLPAANTLGLAANTTLVWQMNTVGLGFGGTPIAPISINNNGGAPFVVNAGMLINIIGATGASRVGMEFWGVASVAQIFGTRMNGTLAAPSNLLTDEVIADFTGRAWSTGTTFNAVSRMRSRSSENQSSTALGTYLEFMTVASTTTTLASSLMVGSLGAGSNVLQIFNGTAPSGTPTTSGFLYVEAGALKYKGSGGTVTVLALA